MTDVQDDLLARLQQFNQANGVVVPEPEPTLDFDPDLIPDAPTRMKSEQDSVLDEIMAGIDIIDAYNRWCGKSTPNPGKRREGIMVSCPKPNHPDKDPSAWLNLDKQVWTCGTCGFEGGDKYDIAAWHFGFNVPGYKTDGSFPELRRRMAEDLGYTVKRTLSGQEYIDGPPDEVVNDGGNDAAADGRSDPVDASSGSDQQGTRPELAAGSVEPDLHATHLRPATAAALRVVPLEGADSESNVVNLHEEMATYTTQMRMAGISIDWESIVKKDTFLDTWMRATTINDLPHEYYFWLGMQALGFAAGTKVLLADQPKVKSNLYVCLYGPTGIGKSRSIGPYISLLEKALPFDEDPLLPSSGVKQLAVPGSSEALEKMFVQEIIDPATMQPSSYAQVRGLLRIEEFASFISRASRTNNPIRETLIEMYDVLGRDMKRFTLGGGKLTAEEPFCQMVTTTQPRAIHDFLRRTDAHSGFLNRWVFAMGVGRTAPIPWGQVDIDVTDSVTALKDLKMWSDQGHLLQIDLPTITQAWTPFFRQHIVPIRNSDDSFTSRVELILKKIILLLSINEQQVRPTADIIERALLLFDYLMKSYQTFAGDMAFDMNEELRDVLKQVVANHQAKAGEAPSMRDIERKIGRKWTGEQVHKVMKIMVELGEVEQVVVQKKRGPASRRFAVVS